MAATKLGNMIIESHTNSFKAAPIYSVKEDDDCSFERNLMLDIYSCQISFINTTVLLLFCITTALNCTTLQS